jgi:hypothetical protein
MRKVGEGGGRRERKKGEGEGRKGEETYQEGFRQSKYFILRQIAIFILIMHVKEPLDVLHQVVEHDTVQS